jgi:hypothetical protein
MFVKVEEGYRRQATGLLGCKVKGDRREMSVNVNVYEKRKRTASKGGFGGLILYED